MENTEQIHKWEQEQDKLKQLLSFNDEFDKDNIKYVGGVDISFDKRDPNNACVYLIVLDYNDLSKIVYENHKIVTLTIPYISGFLAFREVNHYVALLKELKEDENNKQFYPQVLLVDGYGILHVRGFGSASHLGVLADIPTIGCGKTMMGIDGLNEKDVRIRIVNDNIKETDLIGRSGNVYGRAILTGDVKPIYVSIGHKISLDTATEIVNKTAQFRIPEPIRLADIRSKLFF